MNLWQDIVTNALLGTERKAFAKEQTSGALGDILGRLEGAESEVLLLHSAAVVALHQAAGRMPAEAPPAPVAVCEGDDLPACGERSAQHLALMLGGEYREALDEWLAALGSAGKRVGEMLLPALLNYGAATKERREAILAVLGRRGVWLASLNPAWSYVMSAEGAERTWQTGQ